MALYLSNAIAQRCKIEDVQQRTSEVSHILQMTLPKIQRPTTVWITLTGSTTNETVKSAAARETMKKLGVMRSGVYFNTDMITCKKTRPVLDQCY